MADLYSAVEVEAGTPGVLEINGITKRKRWYIQNNGSVDIWIGPDDTVAENRGMCLGPKDIYEYPDPVGNGRRFQIWAVPISGTATVTSVIM